MERPPRRRNCCLMLVVMFFLVLCGGLVLGAVYIFATEPNEIRVDAAASANEVAVGDQFQVGVTVENLDLDPVKISSVGVDQDLLDGVTVAATNPDFASISSRDMSVLGNWTQFDVNRQLLGGDEDAFTFTLTADRPGSYSGDVTIWVEQRFLGIPYERARHAPVEFVIR